MVIHNDLCLTMQKDSIAMANYGKSKNIISWADVTTLIKQIERDQHVRVKIDMEAGAAYSGQACIAVVVRLREARVDGKGKEVTSASGYFPQRRWPTATGCIVGLLYVASQALDELREQERSARPLPLPHID